MKKSILFISFIIVISCKKNENVNKTKVDNSTLKEKEIRIADTISTKNIDIESKQNSNQPKQSKIINSKFDSELLFGIWTYDPDGPHADFQLTSKSFYVVDYDGNGDMPYIINQDTIKVYYPGYCNVGIIKGVTKDSLKIDWNKNGTTNYVKWKG